MTADFDKFSGRYYNTAMYKSYQEMGDVWQYVDITKNASAGDMRYAKRWFPMAVVAQQLAGYTALVGAYDVAKGSFNTEAAAYNTVAKDMKAYNDDTNAFKAAKKFDLPARPTPPTRLHAYAGLRVAPYASSKDWTWLSSPNTNLGSVTATDVVIAGSHSGGWGSFTAGILGTGTAKAAHSFGCFGWSELGTTSTTDADAEKHSYLQSLPDMCSDHAAATTALDKQQCPPTGAASNSSTWSVVVVSVWANDVGATTFAAGAGNASLVVSFGLNAWAQKSTAWAAPTQPGAPDALEPNPLGAKFLAASATAAIAVAAALY